MTLPDRATFNQWVRDHSAVLYKHAFWMTGQRELARDLVQETFYQAWKSAKGPDDAGKSRAWLLTILRRAIYREISCVSWAVPRLNEVDLQGIGVAEDGDPSALMDLARGLGALDHSHRELLLLYALHGLSYAEISGQLDIPIGTVMSRLARARQALLRELSGSVEENVVSLRSRNKAGYGRIR